MLTFGEVFSNSCIMAWLWLSNLGSYTWTLCVTVGMQLFDVPLAVFQLLGIVKIHFQNRTKCICSGACVCKKRVGRGIWLFDWSTDAWQ